MNYIILKQLHLSCITLTFLLFNLRAIGHLFGATWVRHKWLRVVPHMVDTVLLVTGILLAIKLQQYPFVDAWLTAKFFALIAYIIFGSLTLKHASSLQTQLLSYIAALLAFAYLVSTALLHHPNPKYWLLLLN